MAVTEREGMPNTEVFRDRPCLGCEQVYRVGHERRVSLTCMWLTALEPIIIRTCKHSIDITIMLSLPLLFRIPARACRDLLKVCLAPCTS